jgi:hypothetical protein
MEAEARYTSAIQTSKKRLKLIVTGFLRVVRKQTADDCQDVVLNNSRPISHRRISEVPAPIS